MDRVLEGPLVCGNSHSGGTSHWLTAMTAGEQERPLEYISNPSLNKWDIRIPESSRILLNVT